MGLRCGFRAFLTAFGATVNRLASAPLESQENGRRGLTGRRSRGMAVRHGTLRIDIGLCLARLRAVAGRGLAPQTAESRARELCAPSRDARRQWRAARQRLALAHFFRASDPDGSHPSTRSNPRSPRPEFTLPPGEYVVHVAFGLASATKGVVSAPANCATRSLAMSAGALAHPRHDGDKPIDPANVSLAIYVPERNNAKPSSSIPRPG